ncbi:MAG: amidase [Gammaproteobacteria bacterium]|nr:amidase [Gammaproteobacteria bacterium]
MPIFPEYESFDGVGLATLVERGVISPEELLETAISRIELWNPKLNAVIFKMYDQARQAIADGIPEGPFRGVPFLVKDLLTDYAGIPLTSGSRFTEDYRPKRDSELVVRIKKSGLITLGKTNVPEFGLSSVTEPVLFGPTLNPWDLSRSPGGSSGGSAAAVAAGMVPMAHGNDGAGSIRIPASHCGLFGFKPSRGRTPSGSEVMRMWESMVVEHVLTRTVRDSAAMLDVLAGPELGSSISLPRPAETFASCLNKPFSKLQIGLMEQPFFPAKVSSECGVAAHKAGLLCQNLGHSVESVSLKINSEEVSLAYVIVIAGEIAATIKRLGGIIGHKPRHHDLERQTAVIRQIGEYISAADFAWAGDVLDNAARHMAHFFQDYDVLITPTMSAGPPKIGQLKPDIFEQGLLEVLSHVPFAPLLRKALEHAASRNFAFYPFTPIYNISGQPAMSVPLYWNKEGLPMGVQFAGRIGAEETLLQLAAQLEVACPWVEKRPLMQRENS